MIFAHTGFIFGGYTSKSWVHTGNYQADPDAFIFSMSNKTKHLVYQNHGNAIYTNNGYGATFGGGHDIHVADNCNANYTSYTNFGDTYKPPDGINYNTDQAKWYFSGSNRNFRVLEIETYSVSPI